MINMRWIYNLYSFEIRRDVTFGRLHILGEVPWNARVVYGIAAKHMRFMVIRSEVRNLPEVKSGIISRLYKLYMLCQQSEAKIPDILVLPNSLPHNITFYILQNIISVSLEVNIASSLKT